MGTKDNSIRKIKDVNGWKVNHPHSAANIFYALFTLIIAAIPVIYLFIPNVMFKFAPSTPGDPFIVYSANGVDVIKAGIGMIRFLITGVGEEANDAIKCLVLPQVVGNVFAPISYYFVLGLAVALLLMCLFSAILLIVFFVHLIKGYLRHSGVVKAFTIVNFVISLLYAAVFVILFFGFMGTDYHKNQTGAFTFWHPLYFSSGYFVMVIITSVMHTICFKDTIREGELEMQNEEPVIEHLTKVHEVTKVKYEQSSTLPPNLTSIGGHAFAENQALVVANIPTEVTKIGNSAFANCLKLKVVSIPNTVTEIGFNCFFNCVELERINYGGTKDEWKKIVRGSNWLAKAKTTEVTCVDGVIIVNPYH